MTLQEIKTQVDQAVNQLAPKEATTVDVALGTKRAALTLGRLQGLLEAEIGAKQRREDSLSDVRLVG